MNLRELFEMQRKLDEHIIKEKGLQGLNLLPQKILALQVELGELANEWRGFKFWSNNQEPKKKVSCADCKYRHVDCDEVDCPDPLLEEYVDCLHFILSIGLDTGMDWRAIDGFEAEVYSTDITKQFNTLIENIATLEPCLRSFKSPMYYRFIVEKFLGLGQLLGLTEDIILKAYKAKNQVNHARQENGY